MLYLCSFKTIQSFPMHSSMVDKGDSDLSSQPALNGDLLSTGSSHRGQQRKGESMAPLVRSGQVLAP